MTNLTVETNGAYVESLNKRNELRDLLVYMASFDFYTYVRLMAPTIVPGFIDGRHIKLICTELQDVLEQENGRLMLFLPPGSMKSKLASVLYPSWVFGRNPDWQILHVCHTTDFAEGFGGAIRDLMSRDEYKVIFPLCRLNEKYTARGYWETTKLGVYRAAGVGSAIAGKRGHIGICDDLVTEQNYASKAAMEEIYTWWPHGFESRLLPGGKIILINTRWSTMDPSAWLLKRAAEDETLDQWKVVSIPAILTEEAAEMLNSLEWVEGEKKLKEKESYWPEFWSTKELEKKRRGMPQSQWMALYIQSPIVLDGNIIKTDKFQLWEKNSASVDHIIITMDTAFSTSSQADFSVAQVWGVFYTTDVDYDTGRPIRKGNVLLIDEVRGRFEYPDLVKQCIELRDVYNPDLFVIEKKASGQSLIQDLRRKGFFVSEYLPDKDKVSRAVACTPFIEDRRVWIPDKIWAQDFKDECSAFPKGSHDDRVDCLTMAILWLRDNHYLSYIEEQTLEELEEEREERMRTKKFYW